MDRLCLDSGDALAKKDWGLLLCRILVNVDVYGVLRRVLCARSRSRQCTLSLLRRRRQRPSLYSVPRSTRFHDAGKALHGLFVGAAKQPPARDRLAAHKHTTGRLIVCRLSLSDHASFRQPTSSAHGLTLSLRARGLAIPRASSPGDTVASFGVASGAQKQA